MRLIHLVYNENRHSTGMTDAFVAICERARSRGWTFEIVAPEATRESTWTSLLGEHGALISHVPEGTRAELTRAVGSVLTSDSGPALMHTHLTGYDIPAALAARGRKDVSVFWHVHSFLHAGFKASARLRSKALLFRSQVDRWVAQSDNIRDGLRGAGVPADRIVMFPSGIRSDRFPLRTAERRSEERERLAVPTTAKLLLHFGWDWEVKGTDRFLAAVKLLSDSGLEVIALVNRGGHQVIEEAVRLGLSEQVRVGPLVDDPASLYAATDRMVAPSRGEGMPFSLVEALSVGMPVVASDLPGHRFLADHVPGCTVTDTEPKALAEAISETLGQSKEVRDAEAAQSHDWIARNLTVEATVDGLFASYDSALTARGIRI